MDNIDPELLKNINALEKEITSSIKARVAQLAIEKHSRELIKDAIEDNNKTLVETLAQHNEVTKKLTDQTELLKDLDKSLKKNIINQKEYNELCALANVDLDESIGKYKEIVSNSKELLKIKEQINTAVRDNILSEKQASLLLKDQSKSAEEINDSFVKMKEQNAAMGKMLASSIDVFKPIIKDTGDLSSLFGIVSGQGSEIFGKIGKSGLSMTDMVTSADSFGKGLDVAKNHLGDIAVRGSIAVQLWSFIVEQTWKWYQHTAEVNKQMLDIGANLGHVGEYSTAFEGSILNISHDLDILPDTIRKTALGLAQAGFAADEIVGTLGDIHALSTLWSEATPEKQIKLMSDYIKEFGMNGQDAHKTMVNLFTTAQELKKDLPNLNISRFVDQTHEVALAMRKYGLEASDAIALTSTLGKMKVDQARMSELAQQMGAIGLESPAVSAYLAMTKIMPKLEKEKVALTEAEGTEKFEKLGGQGRLDEVERLIKVGQTPVGAMGLMYGTKGQEGMELKMGWMEQMVSTALGGRKGGFAKMEPEEIAGALVGIEMPGIGKMSIAMAESFGKGIKELTDKDIPIKEAIKQTYEKQATQAEEQAGLQAKQYEYAAQTADHTKTTSERMGALLGETGAYWREHLGFLKKETPQAQKDREKKDVDIAVERIKGMVSRGETLTEESMTTSGVAKDIQPKAKAAYESLPEVKKQKETTEQQKQASEFIEKEMGPMEEFRASREKAYKGLEAGFKKSGGGIDEKEKEILEKFDYQTEAKLGSMMDKLMTPLLAKLDSLKVDATFAFDPATNMWSAKVDDTVKKVMGSGT